MAQPLPDDGALDAARGIVNALAASGAFYAAIYIIVAAWRCGAPA